MQKENLFEPATGSLQPDTGQTLLHIGRRLGRSDDRGVEEAAVGVVTSGIWWLTAHGVGIAEYRN